MNNADGKRPRWAWVQTKIRSADLPNSQGPITVETFWEQDHQPVKTRVVSGTASHVVVAEGVDGRDCTAFEAEHGRVVELLKAGGIKAVTAA